MKLYTLHQHTFHEGERGDLEYSGATLIGIYTSLEIPAKILAEFIPVEYNAQFGKGLQSLYITEVDSDIQLTDLCVEDGIYVWGEQEEEDDYEGIPYVEQ